MFRYSKLLSSFWLQLGIAAIALGFFFELTYELHEQDQLLSSIDEVILSFAESLRSVHLSAVAMDVTALGSTAVVFILAFVFLVIFLMAKDYLGVTHLLAASLGAGIWSQLFKRVIARERPEVFPHIVQVAGFAYPSGHSLAAASLYITFAVLGCRHFKKFSQRIILFSLSMGVISLVGLSRIYLGVHYPSDVLGGIFFGIAWAFILAAIVGKINSRTKA